MDKDIISRTLQSQVDSEDLYYGIAKCPATSTNLASKAGPHYYFKLLNRRPVDKETETNPSVQENRISDNRSLLVSLTM
jgi:hypothetical protein